MTNAQRPTTTDFALLLLMMVGFLAASGWAADRRSRLAASGVEILVATGGLPAHVAGRFSNPLAFHQSPAGDYIVFDRAAQSVYRIDHLTYEVTTLVEIGFEEGRVLGPRAFDLAPNGTFVVADSPRQRERLQLFSPAGMRFGGFTMPDKVVPRVVASGLVLSGFGSLDYTGRSILVSQPGRRALVTVYGLRGTAYRTFGNLRETGHEDDREVHLGLNSGIPLAIPTGGFYFVFRTGVPLFRKYDQAGNLLFERHIEGIEIDPLLRRMPTSWPTADDGGRSIPLIPPSVRTASVDPDGNLWVTIAAPYTYVYDPNGEKTRVVQFKGAGVITPTSVSFVEDEVLVVPGFYVFSRR